MRTLRNVIVCLALIIGAGTIFAQQGLRDPQDPTTYPPDTSLEDMCNDYVPDLVGEIWFWEYIAYPQWAQELDDEAQFTWDIVDETPVDHPNWTAIMEETGKALEDLESAWDNLDATDPLSMEYLICAQAEHRIMRNHTAQAQTDQENEDWESCFNFCNKAYDQYVERLEDEDVVALFRDRARTHNENALNLLLTY